MLVCLLTVFAVTLGCFFFSELIHYRVVSLILLVTLSILAMLFDIIPVLSAALISAVVWNFFFIPPLFTFHIGDAEDIMMFFLYFIIAMVNAVLTFKIRRAEKIARDREEKERVIKLYNTLLNSLSHELRTPISTILGAVDTLKESRERLTDTDKKELLEEIDIAGTRLNVQVGNLLNMSRLETGLLKLNLEWADINELIFLSLKKIAIPHPDKRVNYLTKEELPLCKVDSGMLEQVILNLVNNAILYSPEDSEINIMAAVTDEILEIKVRDNGPGIAEEFLPEIFEKFYRVPNSIAGGTGLGLSIVKGFIDAHKGTVTVANVLPSGLEFVIKIPVETSYINSLKNE